MDSYTQSLYATRYQGVGVHQLAGPVIPRV